MKSCIFQKNGAFIIIADFISTDKCSPQEIMCDNKMNCYSSYEKCNNKDDCAGDMTDEQNCSKSPA